MYSWGSGLDGKLGINSNYNEYIPKKIKVKGDFSQISCGSHHSAAVTKDGELYIWGHKSYFCIGNDVY